ncbi:hypothetical protein ACTFIT_000361 [Dictyostelium discoideum]
MKFDGPTRVLVLFYDLPKDDSSSELSQTGLKIGHYILETAFKGRFKNSHLYIIHFNNGDMVYYYTLKHLQKNKSVDYRSQHCIHITDPDQLSQLYLIIEKTNFKN